MTLSLKTLPDEEFIAPGRGGCAGCPAVVGARMATKVMGKNTIMITSTGCMCVNYGYYGAPLFPFVHTLFENAGSILSGIDVGLTVLGKREGVNLVAFCGDGGTVDIGLQALSGAAERGHRFLYICYDNEGYMNTGAQRSGATPPGARTSTTPVTARSAGEPRPFIRKKDMVRIMAAHGIPYAAFASVAYPLDYLRKIEKALSIDGPTYIHLQTPCLTGWGIAEDRGIEVARMAVETCVFPLYEIEEGRKLKITVRPSRKRPVEEYFVLQGRFRHLLKKELRSHVERFQREVDERWNWLMLMEKCSGGLYRG